MIDEGPGIAPEHLPRLTERFYRIDVASSREKGGTGLGLAIVKHILNRHRGELAISSRPGKGSSFTVLLDAAREALPVKATRPNSRLHQARHFGASRTRASRPGGTRSLRSQASAALESGGLRRGHPPTAPRCPQAIFGPFRHCYLTVHISDIVALLRGVNAPPTVGEGSPAGGSYGNRKSPPSGRATMRFMSYAAAVGLAAAFTISTAHAADISGAGATFPYPIYAKWADAYKKDTGNGLNYQWIRLWWRRH